MSNKAVLGRVAEMTGKTITEIQIDQILVGEHSRLYF